jgi:hypothetical protein
MMIQISALLIGTLCVFFGYKLLMRGVYPEGDAKAVWGDTGLLIKRSAPGVIFALFGAAMITMGLLHGAALRHRDSTPAAEQTQIEDTQPARQSAPAQTAKRKHRAVPQQAQQPAKPDPEVARDTETQPAPAKTWKPGRA